MKKFLPLIAVAIALIIVPSVVLSGCSSKPAKLKLKLEETVISWNAVKYKDYEVTYRIRARAKGGNSNLSVFTGIEGSNLFLTLVNTPETQFDLSRITAENKAEIHKIRVRVVARDGEGTQYLSKWAVIKLPAGFWDPPAEESEE